MANLVTSSRPAPLAELRARSVVRTAWMKSRISRPGDRPFDIPAVLGRYAFRCHIGAIDREAGDHRAQRPAQPVPRIVAAVPVALRDTMKIGRENAELAAEHGIHHEMLRVAEQLIEI